MIYKKGDLVTWDVWGRGIDTNGKRTVVHHAGRVFEVIPAGILPHEINNNCRGVASTALPRGEESYVIYEYTKLYWPKASKLFPKPEAPIDL